MTTKKSNVRVKYLYCYRESATCCIIYYEDLKGLKYARIFYFILPEVTLLYLFNTHTQYNTHLYSTASLTVKMSFSTSLYHFCRKLFFIFYIYFDFISGFCIFIFIIFIINIFFCIFSSSPHFRP